MNLIILMLFFSAILGIFLLKLVAPIGVKNLNFLSYQYFMHFIFLVVPGSIIIAFGFRDELALMPVSDETVFYTCLAIVWCVISFPLTLLIIDALAGKNLRERFLNYKMQLYTPLNNPKVTLRNITIITFISTCFLFILIYILPVVPIFHIGADAEFIMNSRLESSFDIPPAVFFLRRVMIYFLPIFFLFTYIVNRYNKVNKITYFTCLFNAVFILTYSTEKAPLILLIFSIFFLKNSLEPNYSFSLKKVFLIFISLIAIMFVMVALLYGNDLNDAGLSLVKRMFISQIAGSFLSMEYYGLHAPFKYFDAIFFRLDSLLGGVPTMQISEELVKYYYSELFNSNLWRNVNSFIVQGAWGSFGWFGIFIAPIWCALIMYFSVLYIISKPKTAANLSIYSYSTIFMVSLSTNFNNFIYSTGFLLTVLIWMFLKKI